MKKRYSYIKNIILPCLIFSSLVGILTSIVVFLFKFISSKVINFSSYLYSYLNDNKIYLLIAIPCVILLSFISYIIYKKCKTTRGGGIPTAIGILRGVFSFKWIPTFIGTFISSLITFFVGVPLGNEGPSVMLGTSLGRGITDKCAKKNKAWDRYIMTGGATSGFAVATNAPISGIFFALEETHQRFSPMIIMTACCSVMFGMVMGLFSVLFSKMYTLSNIVVKKIKMHKFIKIMLIFLLTFLIGFISLDFIGTGHDLIKNIFNIETTPMWYILILILLFRSIMTLLSNNEGITGGLFIATLAIESNCL